MIKMSYQGLHIEIDEDFIKEVKENSNIDFELELFNFLRKEYKKDNNIG